MAGVRPGIYRGLLLLDSAENVRLPFTFEIQVVKKKPVMIIRNGDERIKADEISQRKDSLIIDLPVFDTQFRCIITSVGMQGNWISHYRTTKNVIPFTANWGLNERFAGKPESNANVEGNWEVTFSPGQRDSSKAIGVFHHHEQTGYLTGTFLTETGDYRFLEGMVAGNNMMLSAFDGSHAFLFTAELAGNEIRNGRFFSGAHWRENWNGRRNESFRLRNPDEITSLKNPEAELSFEFPDPDGKLRSLKEPGFVNKPVIVQLMGSWCPNCMDESRYLNSVYNKHASEGLVIIGLAFEKTGDLKRAGRQVNKFRDQLGLTYPFLLTPGKDKAAESFPAIRIFAFPTTLFLNKDHRVVKIVTGFSGPATGEEYRKLKTETEELIVRLLRG
jgi:thiol-disulfide isomerase/thioredoxin